MSRDHILIVEDDQDLANLLNIYFGGQGFQVTIARNGKGALEQASQAMPHLIVLDIMLPDMDGYEVCRQLRSHIRTSHIPILFLTRKDERADRIAGLELGADDYITKPFDIEELKLRVQNIISRSKRESLTDRRTGLPSGALIEDGLRRLLSETNWALIEIDIENFQAYREAYGFLAADEVLRMTAMAITQVLNETGAESDFAGHPGSSTFLVITGNGRAEQVRDRIVDEFQRRLASHYSESDWQSGKVEHTLEDRDRPAVSLMSLSIGILDGSEQRFTDIQQLSEHASLARRSAHAPQS